MPYFLPMTWLWRSLQEQILTPALKIEFYCFGTDFSIQIPKNLQCLETTPEVRRTTKDTALGDISKGTRGMMPLLSIFILLKLVGRHEFIRRKKGSKKKKVKQLNAYLPISIGTVKMSSILTQEIEF